MGSKPINRSHALQELMRLDAEIWGERKLKLMGSVADGEDALNDDDFKRERVMNYQKNNGRNE